MKLLNVVTGALVLLFVMSSNSAKAQKLDSIFFNLYTDSLKKGTYNYINVDGKYSDGRYLPLTTGEIVLSSTHGSFEGNSLYIDSNFSEKYVTVRVSLKKDPKVWREQTIYIKQHISEERLKTMEEVMGESGRTGRQKKKKS